MNLLLLERHELDDEGEVQLADGRAAHLLEVLRVTPGKRLRAGLVDGPLGSAEVRSTRPGAVRLRCAFSGEPPPAPPVDLLLALPRPKVLKRLWAQLAALGVGRILLTQAARVEKAYFDSHAVRPELYRPRLLEGLAQARDTRVPKVEVHRFLRALVERRLPALPPPDRRLLADPAYRRSPLTAVKGGEARVLLAIGPEGGWTPLERDLLEREGFLGVGLGPRVLRTDTAVIGLLATVHAALAR